MTPEGNDAMAIKAKISKEELAGLPEKTVLGRDAFVEHNGEVLLSVEQVSGYALKDVDKLMSALHAEREAVKQKAKLLEVFGDLDPAKAREALEKVEKMRDWTPADKLDEKIKAREEQILANSKREIDARDKVLKEREAAMASMDEEVSSLLIDSESARILHDKGHVDVLSPHIRRETRVEKDAATGRRVVRVLDDKGQPRMTQKSGSTDYMGLEELINGPLKERFPYAYNGTGSSGSGAQSSTRGNVSAYTITKQEAQDPRAYQAKRAAAEKAGQKLQIVQP